MRVLIVDDHAIVRTGVQQLLAEAYPSLRVGHAADACEALRQVTAESWDLVLLDISLPGKNGIELLKQLKSREPGLPVVMLSMHPEEQYAVRALRAGALGYLNKDAAPEQLLEAIDRVVNGRRYISPEVAEQLASELQRPTDCLPHLTLSDREYQILCHIASGMSVSEIAKVLPLSVKTVSTYRARVLKKMGMKHNAELTHYAVKNGLVG